MRILILPFDESLIIELGINSFHAFLNLRQIKDVFVSDCSVEHGKQENDCTGYGFSLPTVDSKVSSHTDLIRDNHNQSCVRGVVDHLTGRLYFSSVVSQEVISIHNMPQVHKDSTSY